MKTIFVVILLLMASVAHGQCDTIAPSGKVLSRAPLKATNVYQVPHMGVVLDSMRYTVAYEESCIHVKQFGCPVCGCELFDPDYTDAYGAAYMCAECGSLYAGRNRNERWRGRRENDRKPPSQKQIEVLWKVIDDLEKRDLATLRLIERLRAEISRIYRVLEMR